MASPAETTSLAGTAIQISLALIFVLGMILVGFYALRKYGPKLGLGGRGRTGMLRFVGHLPLGPKQGVAVVKFQDKYLVLGVTEQRINLLTETVATDDAGTSGEFEDSLRQAASGGPDAG